MSERHFAEIDPNTDEVIRVIVATPEVIAQNYTGEWIETFVDERKRSNFAGKGMKYDRNKDVFISKKPNFKFRKNGIWTLNANNKWVES